MRSLRKRYPIERKIKIVLEILKEEKTVTQLASEHKIHYSQRLNGRKPSSSGEEKGRIELLDLQSRVVQ